jgi:hypothetical protein
MTKNTTEHFDQGNYGIDPRDLDTPDNWVIFFYPLHARLNPIPLCMHV